MYIYTSICRFAHSISRLHFVRFASKVCIVNCASVEYDAPTHKTPHFHTSAANTNVCSRNIYRED